MLELSGSLPFLPGNTFAIERLNNHRKSHAFDFRNGVAVFHGEKPGIGGNSLTGQERKLDRTSASLYPQTGEVGKTVPAWVAFDRKVLRFYAYFQEAVHERNEEYYRIRKCVIYFYLEDDTIHVSEPKKENSGIPQGVLMRRQRIPIEPATEAGTTQPQYYTVAELNVGNEVTFYGRTFRIVGCDGFTRNFLSNLDINVPEDHEYPKDDYESHRAELLSRQKSILPRKLPLPTLKKFLENDRRVLRFYCVWDDSDSAFGDRRRMILHYFLADDTIEILEDIPANAGRDHTPTFLRRCRLPRQAPRVPSPGEPIEDHYLDRDLSVGAVISVYGRRFLLYDCDAFTNEYLQARFGVESSNTKLTLPPVEAGLIAPEESLRRTGPPEIPPHTGFGSEEDSLGSCLALVPKPPRRDFARLMTFDQMSLRFGARLKSSKRVDQERRFIVSYFLSDGSVQVYEPAQRNSGIISGKFLERGRVKKESGEFYSTEDFFVGAEVVFYNHTFILDSADEYALKYAAAHPEEYANKTANSSISQKTN